MRIYLKKLNNYESNITFVNTKDLIEINRINIVVIEIFKAIYNNNYFNKNFLYKDRIPSLYSLKNNSLINTIEENNNILVYNYISPAFIIFYLIYHKYLRLLKNISLLNLSESSSLYEVLLYHKKKFNYKTYLLFGNLIPDEMMKYIRKDIENLKIENVNDTYLYKHIDITILDNIIKNEKLYNLVHLDMLQLVKHMNISNKNKNDFSHHYFIKKLYIGLNLLENNGVLLLRLSGIDDKIFLKNILYYLSNFFNIKYKRIIKDNSRYFLLYDFDRNQFLKDKNILKKIMTDLENICSNDKEFICDGIVIKKYNDNTYNINTLFKFDYTTDYNEFFEYTYKKTHDITKINKIKNIVKEYCPTFTECFTYDKLKELHNNMVINNLDKTITLLEKYGLIVKMEFKQTKYEAIIIHIMFNFNYNVIRSLNDNKINVSLKYIDANKELIKKLKPLELTYHILHLLKVAIETRNPNDWSVITKKINIRNYIKKFIEKKYDIKVSRAYCKMYDILSAFNLIDTTKDSIKSFHACEAPGHFINATNDWIKKMNPTMEFDWTANSLNPFNSKVKEKYGNVFADDYGFISKYKERWDWGEDETGDISNINNLLYYEKKYSVDLFTSDCDLSTESMEFEQECNLCFLSISQLVLGLLVLKVGGMMVCKIFIPFTKPLTVSIIYLYTIMFEKVHIIKQSSGSIGSSEVYIVGMNKKHDLSKNNKDILFDVIKEIDVNKTLFEDIPDNFIKKLKEISEVFIQNQSDYIYRSFYYYDNKEIFKRHSIKFFNAAKDKYAEEWLMMNDYKLIPKNLRL